MSYALFLPSSHETQWDLCSQIHWDTFSGAKCCSGWGESAQGMSEGDMVGGLVRLRRGSKWISSPHGLTYLLYAGWSPPSTGEATTQNRPVAETTRLIPRSRRWPVEAWNYIWDPKLIISNLVWTMWCLRGLLCFCIMSVQVRVQLFPALKSDNFSLLRLRNDQIGLYSGMCMILKRKLKFPIWSWAQNRLTGRLSCHLSARRKVCASLQK